MSDPTTAVPDSPAQNTLSEATDHSIDHSEPAPETPEPAAPAEPTQAEKDDKARKAMQKRIDRLTAERYQERGQREAVEKRLRELETPATPPAQVPQDLIEKRAAQLAEARSFTEKCNAIAAQWKADSKDFDADRDALVSMAGPLVEDDGSPSALLQAALTADAPAKVLAHLAANPDVLAGLVDLSPIQQARKIALIEHSMSTPIRQPASTPKPLEPVKTTTAQSTPDPEKDLAGWIAMRNKQEQARRSR